MTKPKNLRPRHRSKTAYTIAAELKCSDLPTKTFAYSFTESTPRQCLRKLRTALNELDNDLKTGRLEL